MAFDIQFDPELARRYNVTGPRYTSYPTVAELTEDFNELDYRRLIALSNGNSLRRSLSVYVHIPFCPSLCYFCGCTKKIISSAEKADAYLKRLHKEIRIVASLYDHGRTVEQVHWGGGSPTFLDHAQLTDLMGALKRYFNLSTDGDREFSIEIDPRGMASEKMALLANLGFNRASFGIQDFDDRVQHSINRIQSVDETRRAIESARQYGFSSLSVDLIYGLPHQTAESFSRTLDTVIDIRPDRVSVYNYAHLPDLFKHQRLILKEDLPTPEEKFHILGMTIKRFKEAGYTHIGMDHFALPDDSLVKARRNRDLHRNFQGYSTKRNCNLVGLGLSAISKIRGHYSQNCKTLPRYYAALDANRLPIWRGLILNKDDVVRGDVIEKIMCYGRFEFLELERRHGINFREYFSSELQRVKSLEEDGLVNVGESSIEVLPMGRPFLRNIAMNFDSYLFNDKTKGTRFSRTV